MIAFHVRPGDTFDNRWIDYCKKNKIEHKIVNCYANDIIQQLADCKALMWQIYQGNPKDILMAQSLLFSLEHIGIKIFPDFKTSWHFDDKIAQKYLLESIGAPLAQTWVFYDKVSAQNWANNTEFPKVFKLRAGAGSQNVKLVFSKKHAKRLIRKAYKSGFPQYDSVGDLKERWRKYKLKMTSIYDVLKGIIRLFYLPPYARLKGSEKGYIYFQEYIKGNDHDIRVIIINKRAFAIKRMVRQNDFRASGSGSVLYDRQLFDEKTIKLSFEIAEKINSQSVAFDFVYDSGKPKILEISYGFIPKVYDPCEGYWDVEMNWHKGPFNPYGWMVDGIVESTDQLDQNNCK